MGWATADVPSLKMDVYFSLQGSCTLADNFVFRIITCFLTQKCNPMVCNRAKANGNVCQTEHTPSLAGLWLVLDGNVIWDWQLMPVSVGRQ